MPKRPRRWRHACGRHQRLHRPSVAAGGLGSALQPDLAAHGKEGGASGVGRCPQHRRSLVLAASLIKEGGSPPCILGELMAPPLQRIRAIGTGSAQGCWDGIGAASMGKASGGCSAGLKNRVGLGNTRSRKGSEQIVSGDVLPGNHHL
jgi:hypothetical protein